MDILTNFPSRVGVYPHCRTAWARYGKARKFVHMSGFDNSKPGWTNARSKIQFHRERILHALMVLDGTIPPHKPSIFVGGSVYRVAGLGYNFLVSATVTPSRVLGSDTNTRSGEHEMSNKDTPTIRARVTRRITNAGFKFKSAHNRQGFPTG
jgi:hypothetical protein